MKPNLVELHEFYTIEDFLDYVNKYMLGIHTAVVDVIGEIEVHLKAQHETIGIWRDIQAYGFIEEYRKNENNTMLRRGSDKSR